MLPFCNAKAITKQEYRNEFGEGSRAKVTWTFGVMNLRKKFHVDIWGERKATVKREDGPMAEPPGALGM